MKLNAAKFELRNTKGFGLRSAQEKIEKGTAEGKRRWRY
jgi:hypothetical protein